MFQKHFLMQIKGYTKTLNLRIKPSKLLRCYSRNRVGKCAFENTIYFLTSAFLSYWKVSACVLTVLLAIVWCIWTFTTRILNLHRIYRAATPEESRNSHNQPHKMSLNYRPIIGILAQENWEGDPHAQGSSYIQATYVKHLESAGARVVPIHLNQTKEEYVKLFNSINGLLLPGGNVDMEKSQCARTAKIFYDLAIKANDASDYFPIWGTCQGFQQLTILTSNKNLLTLTDTKAVALPLIFTPGSHNSRMFKRFPKDLIQSLEEENITSNFHILSLSLQNYNSNAKLKHFYRVLTTNTDGKMEFVSTMEAYCYPFYGVQWHPEKSPFEWIEKAGLIHTPSAIKAAFYTAHFFVSEAMKNHHCFLSQIEEEKALIYNYQPVFSGLNSVFMQNYYFE